MIVYVCIVYLFLKLILVPCFPSITSTCRFGLELLPWTGLLVPMMPTKPKENKSQQSAWLRQSVPRPNGACDTMRYPIEDRVALGELQNLRCLRQCQVADNSPHLKQKHEAPCAGTHSGLMNCPAENRRTGSFYLCVCVRVCVCLFLLTSRLCIFLCLPRFLEFCIFVSTFLTPSCRY